MGNSNVELFVAQARLRDQIIDVWIPSASRQGMSDMALYLVSRAKSDLLPIRLYNHQEEMDRLDEAIAAEEWEAILGFPLPPDAELLTARSLVRASKILIENSAE